MKGEWLDIGLAVGSGFIGVVCISTCVVGFMRNPLTPWQRALMFLAGLNLMHQGWLTNVIGITILISLWMYTKQRKQLPEAG